MLMEELFLQNFRNLDDFVFSPCKGVNIIYGENGQGKTNILEAIWLFTGSKSFRGAKDAEMIRFHKEFSKLQMKFFSDGRGQKAKVTLGKKKIVSLNGVEQKNIAKMNGKFCAVVFSPAQLSLVKDGPEGRRRQIDAALCQIMRGYRSMLLEYNRILLQRNQVLRDMVRHPELDELLVLWDNRTANAGSRIIQYRKRYLTALEPLAKEIYRGISGGREEISLQYAGTVEGKEQKEIFQHFQQALLKTRLEDIRRGNTGIGPHRDDVDIRINGNPAKAYASQGQQRSIVLSMKLAEAEMLKQTFGESPVILLDDIMSELDTSRQDYILNHMENWQVFITCCEPSTIMRLKAGNTYQIQTGKLISC